MYGKKAGHAGFLVLFLILTLASCRQIPDQDREMIRLIDEATIKGEQYLQSSYQDYSYNDEYLLYVYPGEEIECPLSTPCKITYRLLDAYFGVYLLDEVTDVSILGQQTVDAYAVMRALAKQWEREKIYNTMLSDGKGVALDTYCILAYVENNKQMTHVVVSHLNGTDWMPFDYYRQDTWRNVADESWCARLMVKTGIDKEKTVGVINTLIEDTRKYMYSEEYTDTDKLSVIYHMLYLLREYEKKYDGAFSQEKLAYSDFLGYFSYKGLIEDNLMTANLLDVMAYSEYDNSDIMRELVLNVLGAQQPEGHWRMSDAAGDNALQVFTTFRAIIALNQYKNWLEK